MMRYVVMVAITLCATPLCAQGSVPTSLVEQHRALDPETTPLDRPDVVASEKAKQLNPHAGRARHGRKFWISVTPLIVAAVFIMVVAIVVPKT